MNKKGDDGVMMMMVMMTGETTSMAMLATTFARIYDCAAHDVKDNRDVADCDGYSP